MTFITGYQNNKGPYITKYKQGKGSAAPYPLPNSGADILIWYIYARNHTQDSHSYFKITEHYYGDGSSNITDGPIVFQQSLSKTRISIPDEQDAEGQMPKVEWSLETPILARNGAYMTMGSGVDFMLLYSILGTSTPYIGTFSSGSYPDSQTQKRAILVPELVATKAKYLNYNEEQVDFSNCDCEIWGFSVWNKDRTERRLQITDGDNGAVWNMAIHEAWHETSGSETGNLQPLIGTFGPTLFKMPLFAKGGFTVKSRNSANSGYSAGLYVTILYRELGTNTALSSGNIR